MSNIDGDIWMCYMAQKEEELRQVSRVNKLNLIEFAMIKYKMREMLDANIFLFIFFYHIFVCTLPDFFD